MFIKNKNQSLRKIVILQTVANILKGSYLYRSDFNVLDIWSINGTMFYL